MPESPFDSIESAHEYEGLLLRTVDEAQQQIREDIAGAESAKEDRRLAALRLTDYKLSQLRAHIAASSLLLNDLRTLRRLLLGERQEGVDLAP